MSSFSITIFILVVIFIQASFAPMLFHGLVQPDLILTSIAIAALLFDKRKAFAIAMAGGLIQDIIIGNFFGLHLLPYLLITALLVRFGRGRYTRHWYISLLAVVMATIVYLLFSSLILWWGGSHYLSYSYFLSLGIPLTFLNGLSSIILYNLLWRMKCESEPKW